MPRTAKKKEADVAPEKSLEQMILEKTKGKYEVVAMASMWALVLRKQEEYRHLAQPELLDVALRDLLSGQVSEDEVMAHAAEVAATLAAAAAEPFASNKNGRDKDKK